MMTKKSKNQKNTLKIESKKEQSNISNEDKRDYQIYFWIVGIIIVVLLIVYASKYFVNSNDPNKYTYNGFMFVKSQGFWMTQISVDSPQGKKIVNLQTRYSPRDLEYLKIDRAVNNFYKDNGKNIEALYITINPLETNNSKMALAGYDLAANLARVLDITVVAACTENKTDVCKDRPIITCNSTFPVIYLKNSAIDQVSLTPHRCIVIEGNDIGIVKSVNRLLFEWYGIMY